MVNEYPYSHVVKGKLRQKSEENAKKRKKKQIVRNATRLTFS